MAIKKISSAGTLPGPFHWAGIEDQYFAAVFIPQDPQNAAMVTLRNTILAQNSDASGGTGVDCFGPIGSDGYNLIQSNHGCTFSATTGDLVNLQ